MNQSEYMERYHQLNDKIRDIENKIAEMKANGGDWEYAYAKQLQWAKEEAANAYDLATDRGY
jgi:hypothetical protein